MNIETHTRLLALKSLLNKLSDISYAYSQISKRFPFQNIRSEDEALKIIKAYEDLLQDVINSTKNYENKDHPHQDLER
ncbi:MAG: hypothetical protein MOGMAGMI_01836 [Candidatus Omnitrophica bacterium]|nr:hypothetical protein [Candidatus Omnitrophota bacterium]